MNKLFAVLKREYLQAVRKKLFIVMTCLLPFLMAGLIAVPGLLIARGLGEKKVAVLDGTGELGEAFRHPAKKEKPEETVKLRRSAEDELPQLLNVEYVDRRG